MDVTEAQGGLLAAGWAAPLIHPTTAEYALGEHACHLAAERDAALETAAREHAENQRLHERVTMQGQTIASLRRQLAVSSAGDLVERIDDVLSGTCACLASGVGGRPESAQTHWEQPQRGRWIRWARPR